MLTPLGCMETTRYIKGGDALGMLSGDHAVHADSLTSFIGALQYRYTLLCLAGLEAPLQLQIDGRTYGDDCIFIANDWHAAMVPVYLAAKYRPGGVYGTARSVLAIHNLRHQVLI